jgi:DNA-binding NarL/FixJ family response regulator
MIRVLVLANHPAIRESLRSVLDAMAGIECVGAASTGLITSGLADCEQPDVVVIDVSMSNGDGIGALARIRTQWPGTSAVTLSGWRSSELERRLLDAGASAYVLKDGDPELLLDAIRAAAGAAAG